MTRPARRKPSAASRRWGQGRAYDPDIARRRYRPRERQPLTDAERTQLAELLERRP